jgi:hypothetical protein
VYLLNLVAALTRPRWQVLATKKPGADITHDTKYLGKPLRFWTKRRAEADQARLGSLFPGSAEVTLTRVGPDVSVPNGQWIMFQVLALVCGWAAYAYSKTYPIHNMSQGPILMVYGLMLMASVGVEVLWWTFGELALGDSQRIQMRAALMWFALTDLIAVLVARTAIVGNISVTIQVFAVIAPITLVAAKLAKASPRQIVILAVSWVITWWGVGMSHLSVSVTEVMGYVLAVVGIAGSGLTGLALVLPRWLSFSRTP